jgi:hypothetical protein
MRKLSVFNQAKIAPTKHLPVNYPYAVEFHRRASGSIRNAQTGVGPDSGESQIGFVQPCGGRKS